MKSFIRLTLIAIVFAPLPGRAEGTLDSIITPADTSRLAGLEITRDAALKTAREKGDAADVKELDAALAGKPLSLHAGFNPVGEWRCRTMKLGGGLPLVVYPWFNCRISEDGVGWRLDKLSGSQRTSGRFYDRSDTELVYLGVSWVSGEPKVSYGEDAPRDQVARVTRPAEDRLVFEFPKPALESDFDILELKRGR